MAKLAVGAVGGCVASQPKVPLCLIRLIYNSTLDICAVLKHSIKNVETAILK